MKKEFSKELKTVLKVAKWEYLLKAFTSLVIRGTLLIIPILFSAAVNYITEQDTNMTIVMLTISIALVLVYRLFEGFNQMAYYKLYNKIFKYYNNQAISMTKDNSIFSLSRFNPGQYTNMVITDVDIMSGFFSAGVIRVIQLVEFLIIFIYFYFLDVYVFLFTFIVSIIMVIISIKLGNNVQKLNEKRKSQLDKLSSNSYSYFGAIKEVKSYNLFDKVAPFIYDQRDSYLKANAEYNVKFNFNNSIILFVFELFRLLAVMYVGIRAINGYADVGIVLVIYNYYQKIIDNILIALTLNVEYRNVIVSLKRFNHIREYTSQSDKYLSIDKNKVKGDIEFTNALYGFRSNPMLDHISFKVPGNSITVFAGSNEVPELAVFDLLLRLNRMHEGTITIDSNDVSLINDDDYFSLVSSVRRDTILFDTSIKDNLLVVNPDFDKVVDMCKKVGVDEDIMKLEKGYDTVINDNIELSMSARKMLVIVRMLLSESKILLIDDVINILDDKHEKRLIDLLMEMKKDHTILIITHSKRIIDRADLVLDITSNEVRILGE